MQSPTIGHFQVVKHILRYLNGTIDVGFRLLSQSTLDLYGFSDADWAGCPTTRRSTTGYCTFLRGNLISWCAKNQPIISLSSTEVEYRSMAYTAVELTWLSFILRDVGVPLLQPPAFFCDNISALYMITTPVFHTHTKHIELDYHFVHEKVAMGQLVTNFVLYSNQLADIFTKPLTRDVFQHMCIKLGLLTRPCLRGSVEVINMESKV